MKRFYAIVLAVFVLFTLAACGKKAPVSDVSIDEFEELMVKKLDEEGSFEVTEADGESEFAFETEALQLPIRVSGTADPEELLKSVQIRVERANIEAFQELTSAKLAADMLDWNNVPINQLVPEICLFHFTSAALRFSGKTAEIESYAELDEGNEIFDALDMLIESRDEPQTVKGWTYSIVCEDEAVAISAEYVGE